MEKNVSQKVIIGIIVLIVLAGVLYFSQKTEKEKTPATQTPTSQENFGKKVDYKITGIEPGAGIMANTEKAREEYGLDNWELQKSSSAAMLSSLQDAIASQEPVIATVWEPHSAFAIANIRKLKDPKKIYNDPEATKKFLEKYAPEWQDAEVKSDVLATVVYKGFKKDAPAAYEFFRNFNIPASTQSNWIYQYSIEDVDPEKIAENYFNDNSEKIKEWTPDSAELGKEKITLGIPPWPGATVKSHIVARILKDMGYKTEINEMDAGVVYTSLADKQLDVNVAGWLPVTHKDYWEEKKDQLEIAGINVTQTWLGLGIPDYADKSIQSLKDLKSK